MSSMEFTWRMVGTLIWPVVVLAGLIAYRPWITQKLESLRVKAGGFEGEVKVLNAKVDTIGRDIATTLSEMPQPIAEDEIPTSLVDLIAVVTRSRSEGLYTAFDLVLQALRDYYPQLRRVPPSQLPQAMQSLVDRGEMEANVAASVRQLQELLQMPEWNSDRVGDTRGYAFLMLAEGAIHEILRTAQDRATGTNGGAPGSADGNGPEGAGAVQPAAGASTSLPASAGCPTCGQPNVALGSSTASGWGQPVLAVGTLTAQTPTIGVEKELAQLTAGAHQGGQIEVEVLQRVLRNPETAYVGWHLSWVFATEGVDTFTVLPRTETDLARLVEVLSPADAQEVVHVVAGRTVPCPMDAPCAASGLPAVQADQVLAFTVQEFAAALPEAENSAGEKREDESSAEKKRPAARGRAERAEFEAVVRRLFLRLTRGAGNPGFADEDRARNYVALRYPAIYHAVRQAELDGKVLVRVDAQHSHSADRHIVAVRLTVRSRRTGLTEHYQCLADVTEPFCFLISRLQPVYPPCP